MRRKVLSRVKQVGRIPTPQQSVWALTPRHRSPAAMIQTRSTSAGAQFGNTDNKCNSPNQSKPPNAGPAPDLHALPTRDRVASLF